MGLDGRVQIRFGNVHKGYVMTAIEAICYCIGFVDDVEEDGEFRSSTAFDCNGDPHWFAWKNDEPRMCSESPFPFSNKLAPYRLSREERKEE